MMQTRIAVLLGITITFIFTVSSRSQDRAKAVPEMKVLLENDRVRVQFHDVAVGETTPLRSHPAYVAYVFSPYTAKSTSSDGTEGTLERRAGDVFDSGPVVHRGNVLFTRPLCGYPRYPRFIGDPNDASSFRCVGPGRHKP
jgi:hypothetical protein